MPKIQDWFCRKCGEGQQKDVYVECYKCHELQPFKPLDQYGGASYKPKLTKFKKVQIALAMGWSATLKLNGLLTQVVGFIESVQAGNYFVGRRGEYVFEEQVNNKTEIIGYLYAGELLGSFIPEGQKFRVKETGKIVYLRDGEVHPDYRSFTDTLEGCPNISVSNSEVEPYFEDEEDIPFQEVHPGLR